MGRFVWKYHDIILRGSGMVLSVEPCLVLDDGLVDGVIGKSSTNHAHNMKISAHYFIAQVKLDMNVFILKNRRFGMNETRLEYTTIGREEGTVQKASKSSFYTVDSWMDSAGGAGDSTSSSSLSMPPNSFCRAAASACIELWAFFLF